MATENTIIGTRNMKIKKNGDEIKKNTEMISTIKTPSEIERKKKKENKILIFPMAKRIPVQDFTEERSKARVLKMLVKCQCLKRETGLL
jgi:hypothetical protein